MPPRTQRKPAYLTISTVFASGCPRSGKVVTTPMLFRKSVAGMAVAAAAWRPAVSQDDLVEDLLVEVLGPQQDQLAERGRRGVGEPHRRAGPLVPVLAGDGPGPVGFAGDRQAAQAAAVANGRVGGVDFLGRPGLVLGEERRSATLAHCTAHVALQRWTSKT